MTQGAHSSHFQFSLIGFLPKKIDFEELIEWLSNEFILYQQEEKLGIKVYFPNGWFTIRFLDERNNEYEVFVTSKSKFIFIKIKEQLLLAIKRFKHIKEDYSYEQLPHQTYRGILSSL